MSWREGRRRLEEGWEASGEADGEVVVVSRSMGEAAVSSFAMVSVFTGSFLSLLAGERRGQVVSVLILGPKPQPLLILILFWLFGSVLS